MDNEKFIDETGIWEGLTNTKLRNYLVTAKKYDENNQEEKIKYQKDKERDQKVKEAIDKYIDVVNSKYIQWFGLSTRTEETTNTIDGNYINYYKYFTDVDDAENAKKFITARKDGKPTDRKSLKVLAFISYYLSLEKKNFADSALAKILAFANITTDYSSQLNYLKDDQLLLAELFFVFLCLQVKHGSHVSKDDEEWISVKKSVIKTFLDSTIGIKEELKTSLLECLGWYSNRVGELKNKTFREIYVDTDYQKDVEHIIDSIANQKGSLKKLSYLIQGPAQSGKSMILQKLAIDLSEKKSLVFLNSNILNSVSNLPDLEDFSKDPEATKNFLYTVFLEAFNNNEHTFNGFFGYENRNRSAFKYCRMDSSALNIPISTVYIIDALDEFNVDVRDLVLKSIEALVNDGNCNCSIIVSTRQLSKKTMNKAIKALGLDQGSANILKINGFSDYAKTNLYNQIRKFCPCGETQLSKLQDNEYLKTLTNNPFILTKYFLSNGTTPFELIKYICDSIDIGPNGNEALLDFLGEQAESIYFSDDETDSFTLDGSSFSENQIIKTGIIVPKENCDGAEFEFINSLFAGYIYLLHQSNTMLNIQKEQIDNDFLIAFMVPPGNGYGSYSTSLLVNQATVMIWAIDNNQLKLIDNIIHAKYSDNYFSLAKSNRRRHPIISTILKYLGDTIEKSKEIEK